MKKSIIALSLFFAISTFLSAKDEYQRPPKDVQDLLLAAPAPTTVFNADASKAAALVRNGQFRQLSEIVSADERKVGGIRISARNFGETRFFTWFNKVDIIDVASGSVVRVSGLPDDAVMHEAHWSSDGKTLCFINLAADEVELYAVDVTNPKPVAEKINKYRVNSVFGHPYSFLPDGRILYKSVPENIGPLPEDGFPEGPVTQRGGKKGQYKTYQDLIKSRYDEQVYEYLTTSVLALYDGRNTVIVGSPAIYRNYTVSPDGKYILAETEQKPFSYTKKHGSFPASFKVMDINGGNAVILKSPKIDRQARKDSLPITSKWQWRADVNSTLAWVEKKDSTCSVWQCEAPFRINADKKHLLTAEYAIDDIYWGNGGLALFYEKSKKEKMICVNAFSPDDPGKAVRRLFSYSTAVDTVGDAPVYGTPYQKPNVTGNKTLFIEGNAAAILFVGKERPDSEGDQMWFIDRFDLKKGKMEQIWTARAPYVSSVVKILSEEKGRVKFISRRESNKVVPQYCIIESRNGKDKINQVTQFENPFPQLQGVIDRFITYTRADGVKMSSRLYLPVGYDPAKDGRLPLFMWTYPYEYQSVAEAQKKREARYTFDFPGRTRHMGWATQGYAVLQGFSMPIIAPTVDGEPNDDFMRQLIMNAEAAIHCLDSLGIIDPERVAVGGLSYGSFMTTNLMCHTKLFKAGLAMSGAFNRTLTPFGFQNDERSYWDVEKVYHDMSPFNYADSLSGHILFVHGTMDENTGTHPIQSERMFYAVVGNGGDADYVQLPFEGHSYIFLENLMQLYSETYNMLEKYVKNPSASGKK